MKNVHDLRTSLAETFNSLKNGDSDLNLKTVTEINSTARSIISSLNTELSYNFQMGNKRKIEFLEPEGSPIKE